MIEEPIRTRPVFIKGGGGGKQVRRMVIHLTTAASHRSRHISSVQCLAYYARIDFKNFEYQMSHFRCCSHFVITILLTMFSSAKCACHGRQKD